MRYGKQCFMIGATMGSIVLVACHPDAVVAPPSTAVAASAPFNVDAAASLVALALRDDAVRLGLRDVLRQSPYVEHKVRLTDVLRSETGAALIASAARASGRPEAAIRSAFASLPELDVYMPGSAFRQSWRGSPDIVVAAAVGRDLRSVRGYWVASGETVTVNNGPGVASAMRPTTLYLAEVETRFKRLDAMLRPARAHAAAAAIEDPGEASIGAAYRIWRGTESRDVSLALNAAGVVTMDEPACNPETAIDACDPAGGTGGGSAPVAYLAYVEIQDVCDNLDCSQNNEFEWHTYSWSNANGWVGRRDVKISLPSTTRREFGTAYVSNLYPPSVTGTKLQSDIVETDPDMMSPDDKFLPSPQWTFSENNYGKNSGDFRCARRDPYNSCLEPTTEIVTVMRW